MVSITNSKPEGLHFPNGNAQNQNNQGGGPYNHNISIFCVPKISNSKDTETSNDSLPPLIASSQSMISETSSPSSSRNAQCSNTIKYNNEQSQQSLMTDNMNTGTGTGTATDIIDTMGVIIDEEKENDFPYIHYGNNMQPFQIKYLKQLSSRHHSTLAPPNSLNTINSSTTNNTNNTNTQIGSDLGDRDKDRDAESNPTFSDTRTRTVTYTSPNIHSVNPSSIVININLSTKPLPQMPFVYGLSSERLPMEDISSETTISGATMHASASSDTTELSTITSVNNFNEDSVNTLSSFNWEHFDTMHLDHRRPRKSSLLKCDLPAPPTHRGGSRSRSRSNSDPCQLISISLKQQKKAKKHSLTPFQSISGSGSMLTSGRGSGSKDSLNLPFSSKMTKSTTPLSTITTSSEPKYRLKITPHDSGSSRYNMEPTEKAVISLDPALTEMTYMTASSMGIERPSCSQSSLRLHTGTSSVSSSTCPTPNIDGSSDPPINASNPNAALFVQ